MTTSSGKNLKSPPFFAKFANMTKENEDNRLKLLEIIADDLIKEVKLHLLNHSNMILSTLFDYPRENVSKNILFTKFDLNNWRYSLLIKPAERYVEISRNKGVDPVISEGIKIAHPFSGISYQSTNTGLDRQSVHIANTPEAIEKIQEFIKSI